MTISLPTHALPQTFDEPAQEFTYSVYDHTAGFEYLFMVSTTSNWYCARATEEYDQELFIGGQIYVKGALPQDAINYGDTKTKRKHTPNFKYGIVFEVFEPEKVRHLQVVTEWINWFFFNRLSVLKVDSYYNGVSYYERIFTKPAPGGGAEWLS